MGVRVYCNKCDGYTNCRPPEYICCHCGAKLVEPVDSPPIAVVPAPRPENDGRENWRALLASALPEGEKIDFANHDYVPCYTCSTAPGAPHLCRGCLANRQTITELKEIIEMGQKAVRALKKVDEARAVVSNYEVGNFSPLYDIGRCDERLSVDLLLDKVVSLAKSVRHGATKEIIELAETYRAITARVRAEATKRGWYPP